MTAPTKLLLAPPSGITYHDPGILRPRSDISHTGSVGNVDLRFQWDTDNTFGGSVSEIVHIDLGVPTSGTYTLTFNAQTTAAIQWNDDAAAVKAALELLSGIHVVTVTGTGTTADPFVITHTDPINAGRNVPDMTGTDSLVGGSGLLITVNTQGSTGPPIDVVTFDDATSTFEQAPTSDLGLPGPWFWRVAVIDRDDGAGSWSTAQTINYVDPIIYNRYLYLQASLGVAFHNAQAPTAIDTPLEQQRVTHDGTGGTFTFSFSGQGPTSALTWDESAADMKTALEALSNITTVTVHKTGNGNWEVFFDDVSPDPIPAMTADDTLLTGDTVGVVITVVVDDATPWGTGGSVGADGDPQADFNRHLYLLAQVGVGFETTDKPPGGWGTGGTVGPDGDIRDDFDRHLYLLANVTTDQPCPFIFSLSKTVAKQGDSITVKGQGLVSATNPTADAWGAEVRLYASPDFAASFTTLAITDWKAGSVEDEITATVGTGDTTGFIAVVHTITPTCSGSNFLGLTVLAVEPDKNAGWWVEIWNLRNTTKIVSPLPDVAEADIEHIPGDIGKGALFVPANHPDMSDILDPSASPFKQNLIKVYQHSRFAYAFIPDDIDETYADDGARLSRVHGDGQERMLRWGRILWKDFAANPTKTRTWLWGSDANAIPWADGEAASVLTNGGLEDAAVAPWVPVGTAALFADATNQRSGQYSLRVTPTALNDGTEIPFTGVQIGRRVFTDVYIRDNGTLDKTFLIELLDQDDAVVDSDTLSPGSSAWLPVNLAGIPTGATEHRLRVTQTAGTLEAWRLDDAAAYTGITATFTEQLATVMLSRAQVAQGLHSVEIAFQASTAFNGLTAFFPVQSNQDYTLTLKVTGPVGKQVRFAIRLGGILSATDHTFTGLGTFDIITLTGTAGNAEGTARLSIDAIDTDAFSIFLDDSSLQPGDPEANAGVIVTDVHTAMVARGTLDFVTLGFGLIFDSAGVPWPEKLQFEADPRWTMFDLLDKLEGLGYRKQYAPVNWRSGGDTGWQLDLYAPGNSGVPYDLTDDGPAILASDTVEDAKTSAAAPIETVVYGEGAGGLWSVAQLDAATLTALERREGFVFNPAAKSSTTVFRAATHRLDVVSTRDAQFSAKFTDHGDPLPYFDFLIDDRLRAHLPSNTARDHVRDATYQCAAIVSKLSAGGRTISYQTDWGNYALRKSHLRDLLMTRLLEREATENYQPGTGSVSTPGGAGGTGGGGTTAETIEQLHEHLWSEIIPTALGGDLGGLMPSPSVEGLKGIPLSAVTTKGDLYVYDGTKLARLPVGANDLQLTADAAEALGVKWAAAGAGAGFFSETVLGADAATIEVSSIPAGHHGLKIVGVLRSDVAAVADTFDINVGTGTIDTAANYRWFRVFDGTSEGSSDNDNDTRIFLDGGIPGDTADAGNFSVIEITIPDYDATTREKFFSIREVNKRTGTVWHVLDYWARWEASTAIDVIRFTIGSGTVFRAGSMMQVYSI